MQAKALKLPIRASNNPRSTCVKATLYELIDAISDEVQPAEDRLVAEVVIDLFETGKIKFKGNSKYFNL
jgi:predicted HTH domain antitoxin